MEQLAQTNKERQVSPVISPLLSSTRALNAPDKKEDKKTNSLDMAPVRTSLKLYQVEIILFIVCFILLVALVPFVRLIQRDRGELEAINTQIVSSDQILKSYDEKSFLVAQFEEYNTLAQQTIPTDSQVPYFQNQILQIAAASNVKVETLGFSGFSTTPDKDQRLKTVSISISVSGSADAVQNFLKTVENTRRLMTVRDFKIDTATQEDKATGTYKLITQLTGYYIPADQKSQSDETLSAAEYQRIIDLLNARSYFDPKADVPLPEVPESPKEGEKSSPDTTGVQ